MGMNLPYDPVIPLLGIYPKEWKTNYQTNACISVFIAAKFTIAKLWNQLRCPSTDGWITNVWYRFYSAIKKNKIMPFAGKWMEVENIMLSDISQSQKVKSRCSPQYAEAREKMGHRSNSRKKEKL